MRQKPFKYFLFSLVLNIGFMSCTQPLLNLYAERSTHSNLSVEHIELVHQLTGSWALQYTTKTSGGNTITDSASMAPQGLSDAEPMTILTIDSLQKFSINQYCMKCPYINWKGQYFITSNVSDQLSQPYITFVEIRDTYHKLNKKENSNTRSFNGNITFVGVDDMHIGNETGMSWYYKRITNE